MEPLTTFAAQLRLTHPEGVPDFDPLDGGVDAECLFLLEAPGRKAVRSGFVSRNNPDETASNFFKLNEEANLRRNCTVTWNAVPWYIGDSQRIRAATRADLSAAQEHLVRLLSLLPRLRAIVLVGRKAQLFTTMVQQLAPSVTVLSCPHPSPLSLNGRAARRAELLACLVKVAQLLGQGGKSVA